jgi:hypothetical protein
VSDNSTTTSSNQRVSLPPPPGLSPPLAVSTPTPPAVSSPSLSIADHPNSHIGDISPSTILTSPKDPPSTPPLFPTHHYNTRSH